jgi:hypothetical protein
MFHSHPNPSGAQNCTKVKKKSETNVYDESRKIVLAGYKNLVPFGTFDPVNVSFIFIFFYLFYNFMLLISLSQLLFLLFSNENPDEINYYFCKTICIMIAFYNQSCNQVDAIAILGTGLFSAITSTIIRFSMISDVNMSSLMTIVNIFTLAIIMLMT